MNLQADILFKDVVADVDLEEVQRQLQSCVNEWFYPEITSMTPEVHLSSIATAPEVPVQFDIPDRERLASVDYLFRRLARGDRLPKPPNPKPRLLAVPALDEQPRPIYAVSDLHLGDKGPRDNFTHMGDGKRLGEFWSFLNMVERNKGRLIIVGDLFELWQSNMSLVLTSWNPLLKRLAAMKAVYVLGNHDADLLHFCMSSHRLSHPFFKTMVTSHTEFIDGKSFHFTHGCVADHYCAGSTPGIGRIIAIYTGLKEDQNGGPSLNKYQTIEAATTGRLEWVSGILRWFLRKPNRTQLGYAGLRKLLDSYDVVVSGHTHRAGQLHTKERLPHGTRVDVPLPIYNTGTWAESTCSFVLVSPNGEVGIFDWVDGRRSVPNEVKLRVK